MKLSLIACAALVSLSASVAPTAARAADPPSMIGPPSISVSASGSVKYAPDIAHVTFGVRAQSPTASGAAAEVNTRAQAVVKQLRGMGIADADMKTSGYSLDYQPPDIGDASTSGPLAGEVHRPISMGSYVASESIDVTVSVAKAGEALDGAVKAGANQTYGLSYDTSQRDRLYRQALAAALTSARSQAVALAAAAGVQLGNVIAISTGGSAGPMPLPMAGRMMMMTNAPSPPVLGGTDMIDAMVNVVYAIRP